MRKYIYLFALCIVFYWKCTTWIWKCEIDVKPEYSGSHCHN